MLIYILYTERNNIIDVHILSPKSEIYNDSVEMISESHSHSYI